jgi:hypothetical protein
MFNPSHEGIHRPPALAAAALTMIRHMGVIKWWWEVERELGLWKEAAVVGQSEQQSLKLPPHHTQSTSLQKLMPVGEASS